MTMRNPTLLLLSTICNWIAFLAALAFQLAWPWEAFRGYNPSAFVLAFLLLFITALIQTVFLLRNVQITFPKLRTEQSIEKPKREPRRSIARLVDSLDGEQRAELRDWVQEHEDSETYAR
jgi:hypothetical protein